MRVGGARPPPFFTITITSKVAVYAPAEWADTLTLFHLYQYMFSVEVTVNSEEENSSDFCPNYVQEFGLCKVRRVILLNWTPHPLPPPDPSIIE